MQNRRRQKSSAKIYSFFLFFVWWDRTMTCIFWYNHGEDDLNDDDDDAPSAEPEDWTQDWRKLQKILFFVICAVQLFFLFVKNNFERVDAWCAFRWIVVILIWLTLVVMCECVSYLLFNHQNQMMIILMTSRWFMLFLVRGHLGSFSSRLRTSPSLLPWNKYSDSM